MLWCEQSYLLPSKENGRVRYPGDLYLGDCRGAKHNVDMSTEVLVGCSSSAERYDIILGYWRIQTRIPSSYSSYLELLVCKTTFKIKTRTKSFKCESCGFQVFHTEYFALPRLSSWSSVDVEAMAHNADIMCFWRRKWSYEKSFLILTECMSIVWALCYLVWALCYLVFSVWLTTTALNLV